MISAIFACKLREAIISVLTERATPLRQSDLSLVAFLKKKSLRGSKKALNLAKLATLRASLLLTSLSDCSSTRDAFSNLHTRTGISGPRPIRGGVRSSLSLIGLDHDMNLLLNHRETFRVADTFFSLERLVRPQMLVAPLRN